MPFVSGSHYMCPLLCMLFIICITWAADMPFTSEALTPATRPSPTSQPPLHSRQTALPAARFLPQGHIAMCTAQNSQGGLMQQVYMPFLAAAPDTRSSSLCSLRAPDA